jgi:hypothetical protein
MMPAPGFRQPEPQIHPPERRIELMPSQPLLTQLPPESIRRTPLQLINPLEPSPDGTVDDVAHPVHSTLMHSLGGDTDAVSHLLFEHASAVRDRFKHLLACSNDKLGSSGRRRGAKIRHKIGDCEIGFMSDSGYDGRPGSRNRTGNFFFVESP